MRIMDLTLSLYDMIRFDTQMKKNVKDSFCLLLLWNKMSGRKLYHYIVRYLTRLLLITLHIIELTVLYIIMRLSVGPALSVAPVRPSVCPSRASNVLEIGKP